MKKIMSIAEKDFLARRGVDFRSAGVLSNQPFYKSVFTFAFILTVVKKVEK
ncbi:hypothetical protein JTI58_16755 [Lysinibacillus fusiformis]|uniref:hypothetical protein n=1 Tax=Lysinibacillus fusiformis TaxID=28031 RepID=UPI00196838A8|nr:hypothetical protein [Lysinibacillus fusiformis]QSB08662.1 hypothetical protein JTI58_16755 [Lysinibacillus fusiformis]